MLRNIILLFPLFLVGCVSFQPTLTIEELKDSKSGTFFALDLRYHKSYKRCWILLDDGKNDLRYKIDLSEKLSPYVVQIKPGKYKISFHCYNKNYEHDTQTTIFKIVKDKINYLNTSIHFSHTANKSTYSFKFLRDSNRFKQLKENYKNVSNPIQYAEFPGGLTTEEILVVIRKEQNKIRHCYELALKEDPKLAGLVKVRFIIGGDGSVKSAEIIKSPISNKSMMQCLTNVIMKWKFPKPRGSKPRGSKDVTVNYPFVFGPK